MEKENSTVQAAHGPPPANITTSVFQGEPSHLTDRAERNVQAARCVFQEEMNRNAATLAGAPPYVPDTFDVDANGAGGEFHMATHIALVARCSAVQENYAQLHRLQLDINTLRQQLANGHPDLNVQLRETIRLFYIREFEFQASQSTLRSIYNNVMFIFKPINIM
jgi:hypothetical protein